MAEEIEKSEEIIQEQKSSIEVTKNSRGYNWKVKVYDFDPQKALDETIRLELECQKKYNVLEK